MQKMCQYNKIFSHSKWLNINLINNNNSQIKTTNCLKNLIHIFQLEQLQVKL